jgi:SAM-dependent methyltransferase
MSRERRDWALQILRKTDRFFHHPWVTYNQRVRSLLAPEGVWIDGGCGENRFIRAYGHLAKIAVGVDVAPSSESRGDFVNADLNHLPFRTECADLISLCFVVEHFPDLRRPLREFSRVLKKGGKIIILTANPRSPLIFLPRSLLPFTFRQKILAKYWGTSPDKVLPTSQGFKGLRSLRDAGTDIRLDSLDFLSDVNCRHGWIFIGQLLWHHLTRLKPLEKLRTTLLISMEKLSSDKR